MQFLLPGRGEKDCTFLLIALDLHLWVLELEVVFYLQRVHTEHSEQWSKSAIGVISTNEYYLLKLK
jgi:hypothetical protein